MMKYFARIENSDYEIQVIKNDTDFSVTIGTDVHSVDFHPIQGSNLISMIINGRSFTCTISKNSNGYLVQHKGEVVEVHVQSERERFLSKLVKTIQKSTGEETIKAVMPGLVVRVEVKEGEPVKKGQGLVILQAMKMENEIKSPLNGIVKEIFVQDQQVVEKGQFLLSIRSS